MCIFQSVMDVAQIKDQAARLRRNLTSFLVSIKAYPLIPYQSTGNVEPVSMENSYKIAAYPNQSVLVVVCTTIYNQRAQIRELSLFQRLFRLYMFTSFLG